MSVARDSPMIRALPFLDWSVPAAPAAATVPLNEVVGMCITATTFDLEAVAVTQVLRDANCVEQGLRLDRCSAVFHDLHLVGATDADGDLEESSARAHLRAKESPTCSAAHLAPNDEILPPRERAPSAN